MSAPRAEDVKEALERLKRKPPYSDDLMLAIAAARAWLASQEQTPDYEAAADWLRRVGLAGVVTDADIEGGFFAMAEEIIRAAQGTDH